MKEAKTPTTPGTHIRTHSEEADKRETDIEVTNLGTQIN
jgi:hypothetical protein